MIKIIPLIITIAVSITQATLLPFPSPLPKVAQSYDTILKKTWDGIKKRNVDPFTIKAIHRPKSELPKDFVSEGIGYGMILALYSNDQEYFNKIWDAGEQYLWGGKFYNWRANEAGSVEAVNGVGAATDAEQDIALCLIFADLLVKRNTWQAHKSPKGVTYAERAQAILNSMWESMIDKGKYLAPGSGWGGEAFVNPGYFAPAFYRVFDEFEPGKHNWKGLIDQCYLTISKSPGYAKGFIPDWIKPTGEFAGDKLGYNSYASGQFMYKDAIRTYWRLATDYLWYGEPQAKTFCKNALNSLKWDAEKSNFFQMDGSAVTDTFRLSNGALRNRTEHSHLTTGMWACAAMAAGGPDSAEAFSDELLKYYEGEDYWGKSSSTDQEDTLHNELYFDQFLAWFGASMISGVFTNLWEDLKDPDPTLILAFENTPTIIPYDINADEEPLRVKTTFNKTARWSVSITNMEIDSIATIYSGSGSQIDLAWYGTGNAGAIMPQGYYMVTVTAKGLGTPVTKKVWLGKVRGLKNGNYVCIDDFSDGDLKPYIGNIWQSYLDSYEGKQGKSTVEKFAVENNNGTEELHWSVKLNGSSVLGFNPYAALEWNCEKEGNKGLPGLDTFVIQMSATSDTKISVQLVTSDISDHNFFEDSIQVSSGVKEYRLGIKHFKTRWGGGPASPDLSKLTAIRFQIQDVDNTQKEFTVRKLSIRGNLGQIYTDPPQYVPAPDPEISVRFSKMKAQVKVAPVIKNSVLRAELGKMYKNSMFSLVNCAGRVAFKGLSGENGQITVPMNSMLSGVYILTIQNGRKRDAIYLNYCR